MAKKPSYEKLERKVKELEKQADERKHMEEELKAQKNELHTIVDSVASGIDIVSYDYKVQFQNKLLVDRFGDLRGKLCYEEYMNRAKPCSDCPMRTAIENNRVERTELIAADGRNYELISTPIKNPDGTISAVEVVTDITERKQAEEALWESEGKLNAMLQSIGDHVSMMDKDLNIIWANKTAKVVFGNDIIGKKCYEVYHQRKEPCEPYPCITLKAFQDGRIHEHDTQVIDRNGKTISLHCTANEALRDKQGNPTAVLEISRDITERKQMEKALRQRKAVLEIRTNELEEVNTALRVLLKKRKQDETELEKKVLLNVEKLIMPYIQKLKRSRMAAKQISYLRILESNLNDITAPFLHKLSLKYLNFTPKEIWVACLVKEGKTTKEIAELLISSTEAIEFHRKNLRKKLDLKNTKTNLRTYLLSLS